MARSREVILAAVAGGAPPGHAPSWSGAAIRFADPVAAFREALEAAGGTVVALPDAAALTRARAELSPEVAVLAGGPAVAESGAVWWVPADEDERRAGFLAERVVLLVPRDALVDDLHTAYARIDPAAAPYGCFVCGPSKTADIEQALVIGAHGPRALEVWLLGSPALA